MRTRLLAAFLAIAIAILAIQDLPLASYLQTVEHDRVMLSLQRDAWTVADVAEPQLVQRDLAGLGSMVTAYAKRSSSRVDVVDANSTVLASSDSSELGYDYSNRTEILSALAGRAVTGERGSTAAGSRIIYVTVPIRSGSGVIGALRITYPVSSIDDIVAGRIRGIFLVGALTLLVAASAAVLLAGAYTQRLRRIHHATEQLATGDLTARVEASDRGAPELVGLEQAFNAMATRLQAVVESQQSFASDASHQLRTPLTALRLRLENCADRIGDPAATHATIEQAIVDVQRLQLLTDGLLALARLEGQAVHVGPVDVDSVVAERREMWGPLMEERGIRLECNVPRGLRVLAAAGAVEQVLDNYLDNALEVAPDGSVISLSAVPHDHAVDFHVTDAGPGMDARARTRAFDRFWREHAEGSGTGLGLAIAARLAQVSGGSVRLDAATPHGIDAVLTLRRG